jgi:hypothetical protein
MTELTNRACIICRKDKLVSDFNSEHIILDTIGGDLEIETVCNICNTSLSKNFNNPFLSDTRIGICRKIFTLNRSSSNRSIKNPLTRAKVEGEEGENFYVQFENGLPKVIRKPETKITRDETGYRVTIHGNPDVLQKRKTEILKEYGCSESQIQNFSEEINNITKEVVSSPEN